MYGSRNLTASCPECDTEFIFNRVPKLGEFAFCAECETTSEVIEVEPIKLDWYFEEPFDEDEDYDDDDYEDDEYDDDYEDDDYDDYDDDDDDDDDDDYEDEYDDDYDDDEYDDKKMNK